MLPRISRALGASVSLSLSLPFALFAVTPAVVATARSADAASVLALSLADLVDRSTHVVVGVAKSKTARWESGRIVTYTTVVIDTPLAGPSKAGESLTIATLGGVVDGIGQRVDGEAVLPLDKPFVLFARPLPAPPKDKPTAMSVVGLSQGAMPVVVGADKVARIGDFAITLHLVPGAGAKEKPASESQPGRALSELSTDVKARWASLGRK